MSMDLNRKIVTKNAFRVTKDRSKTALRVRVPGGAITGEIMEMVAKIANTYGDGNVHITTRQGFEVLGISWNDIEKVNKMVQPIMEKLEINYKDKDKGYAAAGTRNVAACIGNKVCPKAAYNTTEFAKKIEKAIFPNDFHFKVALTGCPNDCQKVRMHDFGIIGMAKPELDESKCVSCGMCERKCKKLSTGAWTRSPKKYYKLAIMGRSGKQNPRLAEDWLFWADEESIIKIIKNTYEYVDKYIDRSLPKEHIGYIVDRTGFEEFKKWALKGVNLPEETVMVNTVYWGNSIKYQGIL